jgi:RNA-directed DNA polymerase
MPKNENQQLLLDLFKAYYDARKHKRQTANALAFEANYEEKLFALYEEIKNFQYKISPSICFVVSKPVRREIFAADFRDRIVHHLIFNAINPIFEKNFIKDSYSCRIGKGTSYGIKRVDHFIRACSENYQKDCWILKLDISGYFMAMDRNILYAKIEKKLKNYFLEANPPLGGLASKKSELDLLLYLIKKVIFNDPTKNCFVNGTRQDWAGLPKSKSLFWAKPNKGFPIGNLTSQLFGNIYLDEFDHFVKEKLKIKHYGRYVDDMVFVHQDKEFLKSIVQKAKNFLQSQLQLALHPKKIYLQNFRKGVQFLGTFLKPYRIYIASRTKQNFYAKIKIYNEMGRQKGDFSKKESQTLLACTNSYLGIMKHRRTFALRKKMIKSFAKEILQNFQISEKFEKISVAILI